MNVRDFKKLYCSPCTDIVIDNATAFHNGKCKCCCKKKRTKIKEKRNYTTFHKISLNFLPYSNCHVPKYIITARAIYQVTLKKCFDGTKSL